MRRFQPFLNPTAASSSWSFGRQQAEPRALMTRPQYNPSPPGSLSNTQYVFPAAPFVRLPPAQERKALLQPREAAPQRYPSDMFVHPLDAPKRAISRHWPDGVTLDLLAIRPLTPRAQQQYRLR